jgi:formylglycine-generating enzyme required for sulfatase activity
MGNIAQGSRGDENATAEFDKTKVFISYSRKDAEFVARLANALRGHDHIEVFQDTGDILPSEEWRRRLASLIGTADTIVFCLSPNSAASKVCAWEVELAESLNKRILPVLIEPVGDSVPDALSKLNYIVFAGTSSFEEMVGTLIDTLQTNISWIREHSRIGELSRRWETTGKRRDLLLRGAELQEADRWARLRPANAPPLTEGTSTFLDASHDAERAFQRATRRIQATIIVLLLAVIGGLVGYINQDYLLQQYHWYVVMRPSVMKKAEEQEKSAHPSPTTTFSECQHGCPTMVVVPAGNFLMGSPNGEGKDEEHPQHAVSIARPFAVSRTEITYPQWNECVAGGGCQRLNILLEKQGDRPVTLVNWQEAEQYATWLSKLTGKPYHLLTEAEWEYAARAGNPAKWFFGNDESVAGEYAWIWRNSDDRSHFVGSLKPNAFGLYDMLGNAYEWVQDCYKDDYYGAPTDGSAVTEGDGDCLLRTIRGGSYRHSPNDIRSAVRHGNSIDDRADILGFRVGRILEP